MNSQFMHLRVKPSVQRGAPRAVLKYDEDAPELISRFGTKSPLAERAMPDLRKGGA